MPKLQKQVYLYERQHLKNGWPAEQNIDCNALPKESCIAPAHGHRRRDSDIHIEVDVQYTWFHFCLLHKARTEQRASESNNMTTAIVNWYHKIGKLPSEAKADFDRQREHLAPAQEHRYYVTNKASRNIWRVPEGQVAIDVLMSAIKELNGLKKHPRCLSNALKGAIAHGMWRFSQFPVDGDAVKFLQDKEIAETFKRKGQYVENDVNAHRMLSFVMKENRMSEYEAWNKILNDRKSGTFLFPKTELGFEEWLDGVLTELVEAMRRAGVVYNNWPEWLRRVWEI